MHQLPFSFRSSVLRASISASQSLPGYSNELVFDSSFNLNRSLSSRRSNRSNRRKQRVTGVKNNGYISDEYSADISDHGDHLRPSTISRNMSWRPHKSDLEATTDDCYSSSNHPQSSAEVNYNYFLNFLFQCRLNYIAAFKLFLNALITRTRLKQASYQAMSPVKCQFQYQRIFSINLRIRLMRGL